MTPTDESQNASSAANMRRKPIKGGAMLYDPSRAGNATAQIFDAAHWQTKADTTHPPAGRGAAIIVHRGNHDSPDWVLRHYRRGGLIAKFSQDRYLWTGEARTRPFREWRLLNQLHQTGLPVPAPVAASYSRDGATYRGDLITERIPNAQPLSTLLARAPLPLATWQAIGRCIKQFHSAGLCHADLNAHNILIDDACKIFIIDLDRGRLRPPGPWQTKNLNRLHHSLTKITRTLPTDRFEAKDWQSLSTAYNAPS